jgi:hypothetical protein
MDFKKISNPNLIYFYSLFFNNNIRFCINDVAEFYINKNNTLIGIINLEAPDNDFNSVLLIKDKNRCYVLLDFKCSIESLLNARNWLFNRFENFSIEVSEKYIDLFEIIVKDANLSHHFSKLKNDDSYHPAKNIIV